MEDMILFPTKPLKEAIELLMNWPRLINSTNKN
nr:MAG TPA: hypothetical protein [Caudoviricetes sp.]